MKKAIKWALVGAAAVGAGAFVANRIIACKRKRDEEKMFHPCHCGNGDNCGCGEDHDCECGGECHCHDEEHVCNCGCHDAEEPRVDVDAMSADEAVATEEVATEDNTPVE